ncbi:MAG: N-acetylmuramoyl-L-alanine amidase [Alphaproteobacteria bacterium]
MHLIETPSPNHGPRVGDRPLDMLVLHYTGMRTAAAAIARLCDPASEVSAHYTVDVDGTIHAHVPEHRRAWHAGSARWRGAGDVNSRSIGIEIVNPGHDWGLAPFPPRQMAAAILLCRQILNRHGIRAGNVVGHADVAPDRKADPGELFPWAQLARAGIGLWPGEGAAVADAAAALHALGYGVEVFGPGPCLRAFQRRFRPERIDGQADAETMLRLGQLLRRARACLS